MDLNSLFPSNYLKAADFAQPKVMTIKAIQVEEVGDEKTHKPVLFFNEETRGLVMNKTNGGMIAHSYGNETDTWLGKPVELHVEPVAFQGKIVDAIRVRVPAMQPVATPQPVAAAQPTGSPAAFHNDDIDF